MPLYKTLTPNDHTTVKIWKITESKDELFKNIELQPKHLQRVMGMKSELHQCGFLSVRHLLKSFGYSDLDLSYDTNGKPHLADKKHISITHSFNFSAVIISEKPVGIDIEKQRPKILKIVHKFIDFETRFIDTTNPLSINKLTVIWGAKEALYKIFNTVGLSFKQHILVLPFLLENGNTTAWINYFNTKTKFEIEFFEIENFYCVFAFPN